MENTTIGDREAQEVKIKIREINLSIGFYDSHFIISGNYRMPEKLVAHTVTELLQKLRTVFDEAFPVAPKIAPATRGKRGGQK